MADIDDATTHYEDPLAFEDDPDATRVYQDTLGVLRLRASAKAARNDGALSQTAVARLMGTTQSAVSDIEMGRVDAQLTTWQRYARAVGRRFAFSIEKSHEPVQLPVAQLTLSPILTELSKSAHALGVGQISSKARLPFPLVERVLASLTAGGWTHASGEKAAPLFALADEAANTIGMSLHGDRIVAGLMDLQGRLQQELVTAHIDHATPENIIDGVTTLTETLFTASRAANKRVLGIGVCLAGIVDAHTGLVKSAPDLHTADDGWSEVDLEKRIQDRVKHEVHKALRVVVLNDANALAIAHYRGRDLLSNAALDVAGGSAVVILISGAGVGAGFMVNGQVVSGSHSTAGEIGHVVVDRRKNAPPCRVGKKHAGCLETVATPKGILRMLDLPAETAVERESSLRLADHAIASGDDGMKKAFFAAGERFGSILPLVDLLDLREVAIYSTSFMHGEQHATARAFREGVAAALDRAQTRDLLHSGQPTPRWMDLNESTLARAAGSAMLVAEFLRDPSAWYPGLEDMVEEGTDLVLA